MPKGTHALAQTWPADIFHTTALKLDGILLSFFMKTQLPYKKLR